MIRLNSLRSRSVTNIPLAIRVTVTLLMVLGGTITVGATYSTSKPGAWSDKTTTGPWGGVQTYPWEAQCYTSASDNGAGVIRISLATSPSPAWRTGDVAIVKAIASGSEVVGSWTISQVDATHFDLHGSKFTGTETGGGKVIRADVVNVNHNVNADIDLQGGDDNPANYALRINAGMLTIKSGTTFSLRGSFVLGTTLSIEGSSSFEMGTTEGLPFINAISPTALTQTAATSRGNRATFRAIGGTLGTYYVGGGTLNLSYANVTGLGSSGHAWFGGQPILLDHVTFNGCASIGDYANPVSVQSSGTYSFTNCTWLNSTRPPLIIYTGTPLASSMTPSSGVGVRAITNCYFDTGPYLDGGAWGFTVEGCVFNSPPGSRYPLTGQPASWARNLNRVSANSYLGYPALGNMSDCYNLITDSGNNAFFLRAPQQIGVTILRNIFDCPFQNTLPGNVPDCFYVYDSPTPVTHRLSYCLVLPTSVGGPNETPPYNSKGVSSGSLLSGAGLSVIKIQLDHNTACSTTTQANGRHLAPNDRFGPFLNEGENRSSVGAIVWHRDNLLWDNRSSGNFGFTINQGYPGSGPDNALNPAKCFNNAYFGLERVPANSHQFAGKTNIGTYYNAPTTGTTPGQNDITLSTPPNFLDPTRSFLTWARTLARTTSHADAQAPADVEFALTQMAKLNDDSGYNPLYSTKTLMVWVTQGFAPRNSLLGGVASDGSTIGAVAYTTQSAPKTGAISLLPIVSSKKTATSLLASHLGKKLQGTANSAATNPSNSSQDRAASVRTSPGTGAHHAAFPAQSSMTGQTQTVQSAGLCELCLWHEIAFLTTDVLNRQRNDIPSGFDAGVDWALRAVCQREYEGPVGLCLMEPAINPTFRLQTALALEDIITYRFDTSDTWFYDFLRGVAEAWGSMAIGELCPD